MASLDEFNAARDRGDTIGHQFAGVTPKTAHISEAANPANPEGPDSMRGARFDITPLGREVAAEANGYALAADAAIAEMERCQLIARHVWDYLVIRDPDELIRWFEDTHGRLTA